MSLRRFSSMGCVVEVDGPTAEEAREIERLFQARDERFSRFRNDSELNAVNGERAEIMAVSHEFAEMLERALAAAAKTDGLVDPTLGEAIQFGRLRPRVRRADAAAFAGEPRAAGRWRSIRLTGTLLRRPLVSCSI